MIEYLLKSGACLAVLLAVYHLLLEKEKMHRFNRFFLLLSIGFGLVIPLMNLHLPANFLQIRPLADYQSNMLQSLSFPAAGLQASESQTGGTEQNYSWPLIAGYGLITTLLLMHFIFNLAKIGLRIFQNPRIKKNRATFVLLDKKIIPHSFLNYIFLNREEYSKGDIPSEIIIHEFTHVKQQHSLDLLLIELLKTIFWFNPVFLLYKRAIQLNHEFLADETVINSSADISVYQHLLLQTVSLKNIALASNFNYSITKKRLKMMKKHTSKTRKMIIGLSLIPMAFLLTMVFHGQAFARKAAEAQTTATGQRTLSKDDYYKGFRIRFQTTSGGEVSKMYETLTSREKKDLPEPVAPTSELMERWRDSNKFTILLNFDKPSKDLSGYKASDFVSYYTIPSSTDNKTLIFLVKSTWLAEMKEHGSTFYVHDGRIMLTPPPPVIIPAK